MHDAAEVLFSSVIILHLLLKLSLEYVDCQDKYEQHIRDSRRIAHLEPVEAIILKHHNEVLGRVCRAAICQHVDCREHLHYIKSIQDEEHE